MKFKVEFFTEYGSNGVIHFDTPASVGEFITHSLTLGDTITAITKVEK